MRVRHKKIKLKRMVTDNILRSSPSNCFIRFELTRIALVTVDSRMLPYLSMLTARMKKLIPEIYPTICEKFWTFDSTELSEDTW